ncbi:MAG: hypothetical protein WC661_09690 [Opitutaceae bacterium]|jgi:hypothetical protein
MNSGATQLHQAPRTAAKPLSRLGLAAVFGVFCATGLVSAQAQTVSVADSTGWIAWNSGLTGNFLSDPGADQQTGQGTDDYIGNASTPAMMQQAGYLASDTGQTNKLIFFRARMGKYSASGFGAGNGANLSLGIDLTNNGSLDLIMDLNVKGSVAKIEFAAPGTGANTGPSTTSWGNFFGAITLDASTYDYRSATATDGITLNSNGTSGVPTDQNGDTASSYAANAWVTFAISYANLQNAIRLYATETGTDFSTYTLYEVSFLSFIGFTSTQGNAINQDLLGTEGNTNSTMTFAELGVSTTYIRPGGDPVPEPAAVFQLGGLLGTGLLVWAWRRRKAGRAPESAGTAASG